MIIENSQSYIDFDVDNLYEENDYFGIIYNFYNGMSYFTQTKIYDNKGYMINEGYKFTHTYLEINSHPQIKSYIIDINNNSQESLKKTGFLIGFRDMTIEGNIVTKILILKIIHMIIISKL